jgi:hypothetical protein
VSEGRRSRRRRNKTRARTHSHQQRDVHKLPLVEQLDRVLFHEVAVDAREEGVPEVDGGGGKCLRVERFQAGEIVASGSEEERLPVRFALLGDVPGAIDLVEGAGFDDG